MFATFVSILALIGVIFTIAYITYLHIKREDIEEKLDEILNSNKDENSSIEKSKNTVYIQKEITMDIEPNFDVFLRLNETIQDDIKSIEKIKLSDVSEEEKLSCIEKCKINLMKNREDIFNISETRKIKEKMHNLTDEIISLYQKYSSSFDKLSKMDIESSVSDRKRTAQVCKSDLECLKEKLEDLGKLIDLNRPKLMDE